jgi:hypothetical protein
MIPVVGALALVKAHPLDTALVVGIAATGGMLAWHLYVTDPLLTAKLRTAEAATRAVEIEHQRLVAAAEFERAEQSERYRKLEQDNATRIAALQKEVNDERGARDLAELRLAESGRVLHDAETRYLAEQARRAAADPAAAGRIDGESVAMFQQLRRETDDAAGESASEADRYAGKLNRLQDYVRDVCLRRSAPAAAALDDGVGLANR